MHTPGPWRVSEENCGDGLNIVNEKGYRLCHTSAVRDRTGALITPDSAKENARLIAVAPEMLAFAEAVDRNYRKNMSIDFSYWSEEDAQLHEEAKALIAKAKGEQP